MQELLAKLASEDVVGIVFLTLAFLAGVIVWLSWQWRLHRRTEMELALKQDMLSRGMPAEEIERVMRASHGHGGDRPAEADRPPPPAEFESDRQAGHPV